MDKSSQKRHLHEEPDSTSGKECLVTPLKQPNTSAEAKFRENLVMGSWPEEASIPKAADIERDSVDKTEICGGEILVSEASNMEHVMGYEDKSTKRTSDSQKSSETEVRDASTKMLPNKTVVTTTIMQDHATIWHAVSESRKVSPEYESAKTLEDEYMVKYASEYTKELLFSVDVMTFLRLLNNLPMKWISYATSGEHPKTPCNDVLEEALSLLWLEVKEDFGVMFEKQIKTKGITYRRFQEMILLLAKKTEEMPFNEKSFLMYCVTIAHWAVHAERNGVPDAPEFVPLVICHTIQNLKDSGKIPAEFWERIAEQAVDIIFKI